MGPFPVRTSAALRKASVQARPSKPWKPKPPTTSAPTSTATAMPRTRTTRATNWRIGSIGSWRRSNMNVPAVLYAEDVDNLAERDELCEHPRQLEQLTFGEVRAQVAPERVVHPVVIRVELIRIAERRLLALGERPALVVAERRHQLLRDPFSPSQGVAGGHSVLALVPLGEPEPGELLGAMLHETAAHEG